MLRARELHELLRAPLQLLRLALDWSVPIRTSGQGDNRMKVEVPGVCIVEAATEITAPMLTGPSAAHFDANSCSWTLSTTTLQLVLGATVAAGGTWTITAGAYAGGHLMTVDPTDPTRFDFTGGHIRFSKWDQPHSFSRFDKA